jgi:glycosyltransferase involved in cell wall biosynthesis
MKVLVISSWFPTVRNPVQGVFVWEQVRIAARRFDVAVIAPNLRTLGSIARPMRGPAPAIDGVPIARPPVLSPFPRRPAYVAAPYARAVRKAYDELVGTWGRPDVIHAHVVLNAGYAAARLGRAVRIPVVLTEHATSGSTWLKAIPGSGLVRRTLEAIPNLVAVSPSLAARIRASAQVNVRVIGNVVDTEFFEPVARPRPSGPARFAAVGALIPRKGIDALIRAMAMAKSSGNTDCQVRVAGRGPEEGRLRQLAVELGVADRFELVGEIGLAGVRDLYQWADFAALPSSEETFGVAAAEAMAMGRPVVGYANAGFQFVVDRFNQGLVPIGDVAGLSHAMIRADEGALDGDTDAIRQSIVDRFGPNAFLDQLAALYADAIAGRS